MSMCMSPYPLIIRKKKPLPKWFKNMMKKTHTIRYKDLFIPQVTMTIEMKSSDNNDVGIGFHVNNYRIFGWILVFPISWSRSLTQMHVKSGFYDKFTRHINMIQKGASLFKANQLKVLVDKEFGINSTIKLRPKRKRYPPIKVIMKGKSMGSVIGQVVKKYGLNPNPNPNPPKKKRRKFNPSRRNSP